ncbi:MAG: type II toxin-antitoxin system RelE/ParE family toxin [Bacteroidales bacterium]|jgi:phage-related protein|nr:type II toxin-antitoxin system RelE/ParE family toxin [Bacteroidales bacterium]
MVLSRFEIEFLEDAREFLAKIDIKTRYKILFNIDKARITNDPVLFKKLDTEIWEFRTKYNKQQYRLLAFWDKRNNKNTLVICTHGFIKKTDKVPKGEIERAKQIMKMYFESF